MASQELLSLQGIDALLDRFRARKLEQETLSAQTSAWEADHPAVIPSEALAAMDLRFRMIADGMTGDVRAVLRTHVSCRFEGSEQVRFRSLIDRMPPRTATLQISVSELSLPAFLIFEPVVTGSIIDLLVGGAGAMEAPDRDLTAIENRVLSDVVGPILGVHQSVLSSVTPLTMSTEKFIGVTRGLRAFPPTELFLVARYRMSVGTDLEWPFQFVIPVGQILGDIDSSSSVPVQTIEVARDRRERLARSLTGVPVDTSIVLGHSELSLGDVTRLSPGDVVLLDTKANGNFVFEVEDVGKYRGTLGRVGKTLAFEVAEVIVAPDAAAQSKEDKR